jgi:N-methylhydantoinase A
MAGAIRLVSIERGHNPRDFALMPFGGGGALHAGALVKEVGLARALVPRFPGVTSALGCVVADMRHDFVHTVNRLLDELDPASLDAEIARYAAEGAGLLDRSGVGFTGRETIVQFDMSYLGQTHTVAAPLDDAAGPLTRERLRACFERRYRELYGRLLEGIAMRVLNLHVAVIGRRPKLDLAALAPGLEADIHRALVGTRPVFVEGAWAEAKIYARLDLPAGAIVPGPAILEQLDATIFIEPDLEGRVDRFGNVVIEPRSVP